ncbi:Pentatricopeptide repeat-containing protein [Dichanthelium oligosanthes]|uniref:Pentatricopeptide repeat-containing protein n=1 Tax=Dichanthelium oligosanthes TaxID=888268 RepID=A0A1E5W327_9POAL|nr:Pentatricopeptide repeat-containing protein [Dichanthelium oligosanthes]
MIFADEGKKSWEINPGVCKRQQAMFCLRNYWSPSFALVREGVTIGHPQKFNSVVVCGARGPRPRYPRVWKTRKKIGTVSKSQKLVECIKGLSNVKEEVYGALDSFVAWELEFPLIVVKKALKTLEDEKEWKRIIQVFADMEELGVRPDGSIVRMLGDVFQKLDMMDKYEKLKKKYPPPKWEYRYIKGKRIRMRVYPDGKTEEETKGDPGSDELEEAESDLDNELEEAASSGLDRNVLDDAASGDLEYV